MDPATEVPVSEATAASVSMTESTGSRSSTWRSSLRPSALGLAGLCLLALVTFGLQVAGARALLSARKDLAEWELRRENSAQDLALARERAQELAVLEGKTELATSALATINVQVEAARTSLEGLRSQADDAVSEGAKAEQVRLAAEERLAGATAAEAKARKRLADLEEQIRTLESDEESLAAERAVLANEVARLRKSRDDRLKLEAELETAQASLTDLRTKADSAARERTNAEHRTADLGKDETKARATVKTLTEEVRNLTRRRDELTEAAKTLANEVALLEGAREDRQQLEKLTQSARDALRAERDLLEGVRKQHDAAEIALEKAHQELAVLERAEGKLEAVIRKRAEAEKGVTEARATLGSLEDQIDDAQAHLDRLHQDRQASIQASVGEISGARTQLQEIAARRKEAEAVVRSIAARIQDLKATEARMEETERSTNSRLEELAVQHATAQQRVDELRKTKTYLEGEVRRLEGVRETQIKVPEWLGALDKRLSELERAVRAVEKASPGNSPGEGGQ